MSEATLNHILEIFYILIGLQFLYTAYRALRSQDKSKSLGTAAFWTILAILFIGGPYIPNAINGLLVLAMGALTLFRQVKIKNIIDVNDEEVERGSAKYGNKLFIPAIVLAVVAVVVSNWTALGVLFTASGVGQVISKGISSFLPEGNHLIGAIAYILGMVLFTMLMGNAFAAFTVITASIGIPFVIAQGGDPIVAGALAMTGGFCGTLLTPMAANFNTLPVALLEMKQEFGVIKAQAPIALTLIVIHIALMYFWAF